MRKKLFTKLVVVFLAVILLSANLLAFSGGAIETIEKITIANQVSTLCSQAIEVDLDSFTRSNAQVEDGLTIICDKNIDVSILQEKIMGENKKMKDAGLTAKPENIVEEQFEEEEEVVYLFMCLKEGEYISFYTEGLSCSADIDENVKNTAIDSLMNSENITKAKEHFVQKQVDIKPELFGVSTNANSSRASDSPEFSYDHVERVMRNITPNGQSTSYPIVLYKTEVVLKAYYEGAVDDTQIYTIYAENAVTHAADPAAYSGVSGVYNARYGNNVIISGARISFVNDFPQYDSYINMAPVQLVDDVNGQEISFSLFGHRGTLSINLPNAMGDIGLSHDFHEDGVSYVQIEATAGINNLYSMSTGPFKMVAMANIQSGGEVLSTSCQTAVKYAYVYTPTSRTWSYFSWDILYDSTAE